MGNPEIAPVDGQVGGGIAPRIVRLDVGAGGDARLHGLEVVRLNGGEQLSGRVVRPRAARRRESISRNRHPDSNEQRQQSRGKPSACLG